MYYPVNLDVREKRCLVVGGGEVAYRKVKGLLRAGALLTVVAPQLGEKLKRLGKAGRIRVLQVRFKERHLKNHFLIIVATDDPTTNSFIGKLCQKKNLLVNVVDQPEDCTFTVPSLFKRGPLTIAISTNGSSPALSKKIRKDLEKKYGKEFGEFLDLMAEMRKEVIRRIPSSRNRKRRFEKVISSNVLTLLQKGKRPEAKKRIREILYGGSVS
ncbi:MAG: bifunctional precorrin-2 dehydrogenase/sirohydrochlorin ferrochelatase [Candidatus Omnitrophica bacterium]|nr:bifunctional precorrin-2 dehydrogenase/sirohydrochlorin ferrochelatase [Candidatus Omnitrophota bacterium]